jgi:DNA-binding transcriptional regulator YiaG
MSETHFKVRKAKPADSTMTGDTFKAALEKIGITQMGFSRLIGVGGRTVRGWIGGEFPVPKAVALLVNLMLKTKAKPEDLKAS